MNNDDATRQLYQQNGAEWLIERADSVYTEMLYALIRKHVANRNRILDICCGYGRLTIPLIKEGYNVKGIDISDVLIDKARYLLKEEKIKNLDHFVIGNMKNLPYESNSFDFGFCVWASFNFLNTVEDQLVALNEMYRVLEVGGKVLIESPLHNKVGDVSHIEVGNLGYDYFPITIEDFKTLGKESKFITYNVTSQIISGRDRTVAIFTK